MKFEKYQALGNDYLVVEPSEVGEELSAEQIRQICHRHYGIGSDGLLLGPFPTAEADFLLKIYNSDGSEAEKSGNGLRIFSRYLWDKGLVKGEPFTILTEGGKVISQVHEKGEYVSNQMGQVSFDSRKIPVLGPAREVVNEAMIIEGQVFRFCALTIGNPHCVLLRQEVSADEAQRWGPIIEHDPRFPNRTNVQFMKVLDRSNIQIEIWERGAGYTLASGTSSCAASAVAHRLGLCESDITVHMPGGKIYISISDGMWIKSTGPVSYVFSGVMELG